MKTIAIISAYNEEKHIGNVIKKTKPYVDKIIVVNDGSRDKTVEKAKNADVIMSHITNCGKGLALKTGFEKAIEMKADIIITIDADEQHNPKEIPKLIKKLDKADIVIGTRQANKNMPIVFKIGNTFFQYAFKLLFKKKISDSQSGFRAFKPEVYNKILWETTGYEAETEMLAHAARKNIKIAEYPIETLYLDNYKGTTIINGIKIFLHMLNWRVKR